ncbi:MAG: NAD(P)-binding protein [Fulvivirga sp.]
MKKIAIIGGGISGTSMARILSDEGSYEPTLFEKKSNLGGLVACERIDGALFHKVGGHVFNTKNPEVEKWFWSFFDRDNEFQKAVRNAKIYIFQKYVGYPIENFLYQLPEDIAKQSIDELLNKKDDDVEALNFDDFLYQTFGKTLYSEYFNPYNSKLWNMDLKEVPLAWLEGKLPMPKVKEIIKSNILRKEESEMVHATFYYPKKGGSQFIIDRLSKDIRAKKEMEVVSIDQEQGMLLINQNYTFDKIVFTGDVRSLNNIIKFERSDELDSLLKSLTQLKSNGTSNFLCETDPTDLSWLYLPEKDLAAHRIIYTGNFSATNNAVNGRPTCVVEFSGEHDEKAMLEEIKRLPGNLKPLARNFEPNSYIIHEKNTSRLIDQLKQLLEPYGIYLLGRFAEWQYYNMDKCIEASLELNKKLQ